jgi:hypothetical protein
MLFLLHLVKQREKQSSHSFENVYLSEWSLRSEFVSAEHQELRDIHVL